MMLEELPTGRIQEALSVVVSNPYLQAFLVAIGSLIAAKLANWMIVRGIASLARKTKSDLDDELLRLLSGPVFKTVFLTGLLIAFLLLDPPQAMRWTVSNLLKSVVIFIWAMFFIRSSTAIIEWAMQDSTRLKFVQPATKPLFETGTKLVIIALGVYFIMISWGVDPVGWLATAGIAAVAIGLAAQDTLGNLFAGISILADAPYKVGDFIVLDGQDRGQVTQIGLRSSRILTRDDLEITIPNSIIAKSKIVNETAGRWEKQRLRIPVGVAYGSDPDLVKEALLEAVGTEKHVCKHPEPWIKFCSFGDSSLNFEIRCWIRDPEIRGRVIDRINTEVAKVLVRKGIEIPYPKRDLYIKELPGGLTLVQKKEKE